MTYSYICLTYTNHSGRSSSIVESTAAYTPKQNEYLLFFIVGLTVGLPGFIIFLTTLIVFIFKCRRKKKLYICGHQASGEQELKNRDQREAVQPERHGHYGDMEHCYA